MVLVGMLFFMTLSGCSPAATPGAISTLPPPSVTTTGEPVEIVSAAGPLEPINPGGPTVEITLKNVYNEPVISLEASLDLNIPSPANPYVFTFDVSPSKPLPPGASTSDRQTLIGSGFSDTISYPVTINGTLQSNVAFVYTKSVLITQPSE